MKEEELKDKLKKLNFTKEEEFKVEQTNELIQAINKLRTSML